MLLLFLKKMKSSCLDNSVEVKIERSTPYFNSLEVQNGNFMVENYAGSDLAFSFTSALTLINVLTTGTFAP